MNKTLEKSLGVGALGIGAALLFGALPMMLIVFYAGYVADGGTWPW